MRYEAKIVADSVSPAGVRLTTLQITFPRFILAEFNTHRMLCLAGDTELTFDLPTPVVGGTKKAYRMRLDVFVDRWHNGASPRANRRGEGTNRQPVRDRLTKMHIRQLNEETGLIQSSRVQDCCFSGIKPVYEVTTRSTHIKGSADHRVLTDSGWKTLGNISVQDALITQRFGKTTGDHLDPIRLKKIDGRWRSQWQREVFWKLYAIHKSCQRCGSTEYLETHHTIPVYENSSLAFDESNLEIICQPCHKDLHSTQGWQGGTYLYGGADRVVSIRMCGEEPTYDLEIAGEYPNFLGNGVVVHNSRNSASSRAIPVKKRIEAVLADPFVPEQFGRNRPGMQARDSLDAQENARAQALWLGARNQAVEYARALDEFGAHKQHANRLLEPFAWHTCVVTATDWDNFFHLRCHPNAQPEFQKIAGMMRNVMEANTPARLQHGQWHLPYITDEDYSQENAGLHLALISAARCARVSYLTHEGKRDISADAALATRLLASGHLSPFEHPSCADVRAGTYFGNLHGWVSYRKHVPHEQDILGQHHD